MPTTTRVHTPEDQERERHRLQSLPVPLTVWQADTPAGAFRLRKLGTQYALDGNGRAMTLFGQADYFDRDIGITAVNDDDAINQSKTLIFSRWAEERDKMRAAFWPEQTCPHGVADNGVACPACPDSRFRLIAEVVPPDLRGKATLPDREAWRLAEAPDVNSDDDVDADLTVDLDEPRHDTPAEAAALG